MNFRDRLLKAIPIIATWSFNFLIAVLKISVEILVSVFMVLGTLIAMSSSGQPPVSGLLSPLNNHYV